MPDTTVPFEIVIFTRVHSITGGVFLREQRLSDFMNDARDTSMMLRNSTVAKLENPAKVIERTMISFAPKAGILLVFEPPQKGPPLPQRFIKYPKEQYNIFIINDTMEIRGIIHMHGALDLVHLLTNAAQTPFVPITHATVTLDVNPDFKLKDVTVLVNVNHIRFIGEVQQKSKTQPRP